MSILPGSRTVFRPEEVSITDRLAFGLVGRLGGLVIAVWIGVIVCSLACVYVDIRDENKWLARAGTPVNINEPIDAWQFATLVGPLFGATLSCFYCLGNLTRPEPAPKSEAPEPHLLVPPATLWDRDLDG